MQTGSGRHTHRATVLQHQAVERTDAYLRSHLDSPVPLAMLCRIGGLSERGLRNAFHSVCGMSPMQYSRVIRLGGVRRALTAAATTGTTVTAVATDYGFFNLGRFASLYRAVFGETPSQTLRTCRDRSGSAASKETRGECDVFTA